MQGWIENPKGLKKVLQEALCPPVVTSTQKFIINYDLTIADLLEAGKYDWKNDGIDDHNFSSSEKGEKEVEFGMFHFNIPMSSEDVIAKMKLEGFRPATMKELLSNGEKNPEEQRKYLIIELGSVAVLGGFRRVGYLSGGGSGRYVGLLCFGGDWDGNCRFLGVRLVK